MNPGIVILISLLSVTAGLVVYDTIRADDPVQAPINDVYDGSVTADPNERFEPEPELKGLGFESLMVRVDRLERENEALKALLSKAHVGKIASDGSISPAGDTPAFELPVVAEGESETDFDEDFMRSFRAAMEKVETDRRRERVLDGLNRQLDRLGVELSDDQRKQVVDSTLSYRERTREMWRELPRGSDEATREERRQAFEVVRDEFSTTIYNMVPSAEAEKIVEGMGRGIGFSSRRTRGDTGMRGARGK